MADRQCAVCERLKDGEHFDFESVEDEVLLNVPVSRPTMVLMSSCRPVGKYYKWQLFNMRS